MTTTMVKDKNFNMRINDQKKGGIPFDVRMPHYNKETEAAMKEARDIVAGKVEAKSYSSAHELFSELDQ